LPFLYDRVFHLYENKANEAKDFWKPNQLFLSEFPLEVSNDVEDFALFSKPVGFLFDAKHVCNDKSKVIATVWVSDIWDMAADNADTGKLKCQSVNFVRHDPDIFTESTIQPS